MARPRFYSVFSHGVAIVLWWFLPSSVIAIDDKDLAGAINGNGKGAQYPLYAEGKGGPVVPVGVVGQYVGPAWLAGSAGVFSRYPIGLLGRIGLDYQAGLEIPWNYHSSAGELTGAERGHSGEEIRLGMLQFLAVLQLTNYKIAYMTPVRLRPYLQLGVGAMITTLEIKNAKGRVVLETSGLGSTVSAGFGLGFRPQPASKIEFIGLANYQLVGDRVLGHMLAIQLGVCYTLMGGR